MINRLFNPTALSRTAGWLVIIAVLALLARTGNAHLLARQNGGSPGDSFSNQFTVIMINLVARILSVLLAILIACALACALAAWAIRAVQRSEAERAPVSWTVTQPPGPFSTEFVLTRAWKPWCRTTLILALICLLPQWIVNLVINLATYSPSLAGLPGWLSSSLTVLLNLTQPVASCLIGLLIVARLCLTSLRHAPDPPDPNVTAADKD